MRRQGGSQGNLFLPVSDVMLAEVIDEARDMGRLFLKSWSASPRTRTVWA